MGQASMPADPMITCTMFLFCNPPRSDTAAHGMLQAVNFFSYDMYRKVLLKVSGKANEPNRAERFAAGALAGM